MKNIMILCLVLFLSNCSNNSEKPLIDNSLIEYDEQSIILNENKEAGFDSLETIDFGIINVGQIKIKSIYITNKSQDSISLNLSKSP